MRAQLAVAVIVLVGVVLAVIAALVAVGRVAPPSSADRALREAGDRLEAVVREYRLAVGGADAHLERAGLEVGEAVRLVRSQERTLEDRAPEALSAVLQRFEVLGDQLGQRAPLEEVEANVARLRGALDGLLDSR